MKLLFFIVNLFISPLCLQAQDIKTIAGTGVVGYTGDNGPAISAEFDRPDVVRFDHSGNMYIAVELSSVVRKINTSGIITTVAGTGTFGYSGDGGEATNAKLAQPLDAIFDQEGNLYIPDCGNGTIRKVTTAGIISTIAGTGLLGESGDNGPATSAQLYDPLGLVFDIEGNLYFSDNFEYRVRKINTSGIITTIAGTGHSGYSGDNGPATAAEIGPVGYLGIDNSGNLYLPDYNSRVRMIDLNTGIITTVVGNGTSSSTGDGYPATAATLMSPVAVNFDQYGNMYISDRIAVVIRKVNTSGIITTVAGNDTVGYSGDGGPATSAEFNYDVNCSAIDAGGNLFIADPNNNRIRRVTYNAEGVKNIKALQNNITIYPNPATNTITLTCAVSVANAAIEISNVLGEVVFNKSYNNLSQTDIDVGGFASGVYFVKVNGVYAGKFVKE